MGLILAFWAPPHLTRDRLFGAQRDDCLACFRAVKEEVERQGGSCHTHDWFQTNGMHPETLIFLDIPKQPVGALLGPWLPKVRRALILQEPPIVIPHNYELERHREFDLIFTWDDRFLDNPRYRKLNYGHLFPAAIDWGDADGKKLCTMIAGNRRSDHPLELYSERARVVRWFEEFHPDDFDLYGFGWDRRLFGGNRLMRGLNRIQWFTRMVAHTPASWRGSVQEKRSVLQQYRFAICYENCRGVPGYITEKIFDCFFAGCVPVYWGPDNVTDAIPPGCFIDRRQFSTNEEMYRFMKEMTAPAYAAYQKGIETFLCSEAAYPFTCACFAKTIVNGITGE